MRKISGIVFVFGLLCSGCVSLETMPSTPAQPTVAVDPVFRVALGMTREEVSAIIGSSVIVGYEIDQQSGATRPIRADRLFGTEVVVLGESMYQIDEYLLPVDAVPVPSPGKDRDILVFRDNILVARGDSEWQKLKDKNQAP